MLEIRRLRINDARHFAASKKAKEEEAWLKRSSQKTPQKTSTKKEEVRTRQDARKERHSQGKQLDKAAFTADKSADYQRGLRRDDA